MPYFEDAKKADEKLREEELTEKWLADLARHQKQQENEKEIL